MSKAAQGFGLFRSDSHVVVDDRGRGHAIPSNDGAVRTNSILARSVTPTKAETRPAHADRVWTIRTSNRSGGGRCRSGPARGVERLRGERRSAIAGGRDRRVNRRARRFPLIGGHLARVLVRHRVVGVAAIALKESASLHCEGFV